MLESEAARSGNTRPYRAWNRYLDSLFPLALSLPPTIYHLSVFPTVSQLVPLFTDRIQLPPFRVSVPPTGRQVRARTKGVACASFVAMPGRRTDRCRLIRNGRRRSADLLSCFSVRNTRTQRDELSLEPRYRLLPS